MPANIFCMLHYLQEYLHYLPDKPIYVWKFCSPKGSHNVFHYPPISAKMNIILFKFNICHFVLQQWRIALIHEVAIAPSVLVSFKCDEPNHYLLYQMSRIWNLGSQITDSSTGQYPSRGNTWVGAIPESGQYHENQMQIWYPLNYVELSYPVITFVYHTIDPKSSALPNFFQIDIIDEFSRE